MRPDNGLGARSAPRRCCERIKGSVGISRAELRSGPRRCRPDARHRGSVGARVGSQQENYERTICTHGPHIARWYFRHAMRRTEFTYPSYRACERLTLPMSETVAWCGYYVTSDTNPP